MRNDPLLRLCRSTAAALLALALPLVAVPSCGDDRYGGGGDPTDTGHSCATPGDCYPGIDSAQIQGEIVCIDRVPGGYCSHRCTTDADCCAVSGECGVGHPEVCGPFESTGELYCFLSCENADVGGEDPDAYCHDFAGTAFGCRSTGGGSQNRKVCVP